jgi:hypothetical protein
MRDGWLAAGRQEYQQPFAGHSTSNGRLLAEKGIFRYPTAGRKFVSKCSEGDREAMINSQSSVGRNMEALSEPTM